MIPIYLSNIHIGAFQKYQIDKLPQDFSQKHITCVLNGLKKNKNKTKTVRFSNLITNIEHMF